MYNLQQCFGTIYMHEQLNRSIIGKILVFLHIYCNFNFTAYVNENIVMKKTIAVFPFVSEWRRSLKYFISSRTF